MIPEIEYLDGYVNTYPANNKCQINTIFAFKEKNQTLRLPERVDD